MKKKTKGLFSQTEVIGTSIVTESIKVELIQVTMFKQSQKCIVYQIIVNGDMFVSLDNRAFAFYLLNYFDFKDYFKNYIDECEDDFLE